MTPVITPRHYFDHEIYEKEQELLFRREWQFAAFANELPNENDFIVRDIGGKSVFVQRLEGQLKAFENVCSHRFSRLHTACKGNSRIRCPYHGWMYDEGGFPCAIPHRPKFDDLSEEMVHSLRLPVWQLEQCGNLVFVREQTAGSGLREFLGGRWFELEQISMALGPCIDKNEMTIDANWKIVVENTLEVYHVDFVHTSSFKRLGTNSDPGTVTFDPPHSRYASPLSPKVEANCKVSQKLFEKRPFATGGYLHQLVFPNVTVATTHGTSFAFQHMEPLGPNQTRFTSYVFQTRVDEPLLVSKEPLREAINMSVVAFNRQVFEEDRSICEGVHRGAQQARGMGLLSDEETRIGAFQQHYASCLDETSESEDCIPFRQLRVGA